MSTCRKVKEAAGVPSLRLEYIEAGSLSPNPLNWRTRQMLGSARSSAPTGPDFKRDHYPLVGD